MHVETWGSGPRVVFVHGAVADGRTTWGEQRPLAERFQLDVLDRPGFGRNPPVERIDFAADAPQVAELLGEGAHLVAHSYGGVIALLAAAARPDAVRSLVVGEPPAFGCARGHPAVEEFVTGIEELSRAGPADDEEYLRGFLGLVGSTLKLPSPLPPGLERGARNLRVERFPWEAEIDLDRLAAAPWPKLVVSGAHHAAFDAVCDVLAGRLGAERAVLPGAGHSVQRAPGYNDVLERFLASAEAQR